MRIRVVKAVNLIYGVAFILIVVALVGLGARLLAGDSAAANLDEPVQMAKGEETPAVSRGGARTEGGVVQWLGEAVFGVDVDDPKSLITYPIPSLSGGEGEDTAQASANIDTGDTDGHENENSGAATEVPEAIQVEVENLTDNLAPITSQGDGPQILIYHTHNFEAYAQDAANPYEETEAWRTKDNNFNVARVGAELTDLLNNQYGIPTIHDTTLHEPPKLGTAYNRSLTTMESQLSANPELKMVIDLHRDAYIEGSKEANTVTIDGKKVARVMVVIGTGQGKAGGFEERPNWQENYKLGLKVTNNLNDIAPGIAKEVDVKTGRFNQHLSTGCILIEVGNNANTLEEVLNAVPYIAEAISLSFEN
jgi:stage II sporulation protein P